MLSPRRGRYRSCLSRKATPVHCRGYIRLQRQAPMPTTTHSNRPVAAAHSSPNHGTGAVAAVRSQPPRIFVPSAAFFRAPVWSMLGKSSGLNTTCPSHSLRPTPTPCTIQVCAQSTHRNQVAHPGHGFMSSRQDREGGRYIKTTGAVVVGGGWVAVERPLWLVVTQTQGTGLGGFQHTGNAS